MNVYENKIELTELANKLFMYTDSRDWQKLITEVFTATVLFDMSNAGGEAPKILPAKEICDMWQEGLKNMDAIHHQAGHYIIEVNGPGADIYGYAMAMHYKKTAIHGSSRLFVGTYNLKAVDTAVGWRLSAFKYNLKFIDGNTSME